MPLVLVLPAVALTFIVMWITLYGMQRGGESWLNPLLASIVHPRKSFWGRVLSIALIPLRPLASAAVRAYHAVLHVISVAVSHQMGPMRHWMEGNTAREHVVSHAHARFMSEVATGFGRTTDVVIPRKVHKEVRPVSRRAKAAWLGAAAAAAALARFRARTNHEINAHIKPQLHAATHATTVALPRAIGRIRARERALEREVEHPSTRRLSRLAKALWGVALAGLFVRVLARRFPWLFCRKVKTVGGRLCGMDNDLLNSLILDTLVLSGTISVVGFARELQAVEGAAVGLIRDFVDEL